VKLVVLEGCTLDVPEVTAVVVNDAGTVPSVIPRSNKLDIDVIEAARITASDSARVPIVLTGVP
jgi:hypothetical protein